MKKILSLLSAAFLTIILTVGFLVWDRYRKNSETFIPFPYEFETSNTKLEVDSPILIIGDRMGERLLDFKVHLAETISTGLVNPIKIQGLAKKGKGIHRTIQDVESLSKWPQILIYQGGSEEFSEQKFLTKELKNIHSNFQLFRNDKIQTLLVLYPWFSRILYWTVEKVQLSERPSPSEEVTDETEYLERLELELLLFEEHLKHLVSLSRDRNALLILTTTPLNLDEAPQKSCSFSTSSELQKELGKLRDFLRDNNPKEAYLESSKLMNKFPGNADLLYLHGQVAKRLGKTDESLTSLVKASAFECLPWRSTEVHNSIIRKVARENQVMLFDFAQMMEKNFIQEETFVDELYPQNRYYEMAMEQLGLAIKGILKL